MSLSIIHTCKLCASLCHHFLLFYHLLRVALVCQWPLHWLYTYTSFTHRPVGYSKISTNTVNMNLILILHGNCSAKLFCAKSVFFFSQKGAAFYYFGNEIWGEAAMWTQTHKHSLYFALFWLASEVNIGQSNTLWSIPNNTLQDVDHNQSVDGVRNERW